jgi:hypothetical protein
MALIPTGYGQANFIYSGASIPNGAQWTLGFQQLGSGSPESVASLILSAYESEGMDGFHAAAVVLDEVMVKFGPTDTGPSGSAFGPVPGVLSGEPMPGQVSSLVQKLTAFGGRAGRGRMYIPGISETAVAGNSQWDSGSLAARQTNLDDFYDQLKTYDVSPVVLHGAGSPLTTPTDITQFRLQALVATQRRRIRP